jgi:hypothetical protein
VARACECVELFVRAGCGVIIAAAGFGGSGLRGVHHQVLGPSKITANWMEPSCLPCLRLESLLICVLPQSEAGRSAGDLSAWSAASPPPPGQGGCVLRSSSMACNGILVRLLLLSCGGGPGSCEGRCTGLRRHQECLQGHQECRLRDAHRHIQTAACSQRSIVVLAGRACSACSQCR